MYAADLDGDRDPDVLSASRRDSKIAWHETLGGGAFSNRRVITTRASCAESVYAADIDGDGDPDVLSASQCDDKIAWYENLSDHGDDHGDVRRISATLGNRAAGIPARDAGVGGRPRRVPGGDRERERCACLLERANVSWDTRGALIDAEGRPFIGWPETTIPVWGRTSRIEAEVDARNVHYIEVYRERLLTNCVQGNRIRWRSSSWPPAGCTIR